MTQYLSCCSRFYDLIVCAIVGIDETRGGGGGGSSNTERCGLRSHWDPLPQKIKGLSALLQGCAVCLLYAVPACVRITARQPRFLGGLYVWVFCEFVGQCQPNRSSSVGALGQRTKRLSLHINRPACLCNLNHPFSRWTSLSLFSTVSSSSLFSSSLTVAGVSKVPLHGTGSQPLTRGKYSTP